MFGWFAKKNLRNINCKYILSTEELKCPPIIQLTRKKIFKIRRKKNSTSLAGIWTLMSRVTDKSPNPYTTEDSYVFLFLSHYMLITFAKHVHFATLTNDIFAHICAYVCSSVCVRMVCEKKLRKVDCKYILSTWEHIHNMFIFLL